MTHSKRRVATVSRAVRGDGAEVLQVNPNNIH
jgi:hypothetical protein